MIQGVIIQSKTQIPDSRGTVKFFLEDARPMNIAACYVTTVYRGVIKGWHGYQTKTIHYVVPHGMIKLVLFDNRPKSPTYDQIDEIYIGDFNYCMVTIPPGVMNAFQGIGDPTSLAVVAADEVYNELTMIRWPIKNEYIEYDWSKINK